MTTEQSKQQAQGEVMIGFSDVGSMNLRAAASKVADSLTHTHAALTTGAGTTPNTAAATSAGGTISSNDFLTLLVTEMKNQDPTQPTDPNAYIQQLVGVNSLQQLISINKELTPQPAAAPIKTTLG